MVLIEQKIAEELSVTVKQVNSAIALLDDGATVPFIARYRKEATQGLTDTHLRELEQRLRYLRELEQRRAVIITSIDQQNKLTPALQQQLQQADNKTALEDLYLPYKPKRRTKGEIAKQAGLEPLADALFANWQLSPQQEATTYLNEAAGFATEEDVLNGVIAILAERFSEDAALLQKLRKHMLKQAHLTSRVVKSKQKEAAKYRDYFDHSEKLCNVPSHRALAMLRGKNDGLLRLKVEVDPGQEVSATSSAEQVIFEHYRLQLSAQAAAKYLTQVVHYAWKEKLSKSLETEQLTLLREQAEQEAIKVFSRNLFDLLMAAPAGAKTTLGLDPGLRTGCKLATVDATGKLLHTSTIFPHAPQNNWDKSVRTLVNLVKQHKVELIAIGNGTASRESEQLVSEVISTIGSDKLKKVVVSEAGASIYSASEYGSKEFPDLDVSLRGAVSIARRLQDPLAELVKIDPKAIGVGQYQHDVSQSLLSQALDNVIEDCVNNVGVDLNQASAALLTRVAGLTKTMAQNIVSYRDQHGRFANRQQLNKVPRVGPKAFEQAAGFLRIAQGDNPLDQSAVHPESYPVVEKILSALGQSDVKQFIGDNTLLAKINLNTINADVPANEVVGELTLNDIVTELVKPGRDPRPEFKTATFKEGVNTVNDLTVGMVLEGVISNVANFGAFVDIGVHQDGLVHISALTNKFISDPREVVKAGDVVTVKVTEVDVERKRIALTMRLDDDVSAPAAKHANKTQQQGAQKKPHATNKAAKPNRAKPASRPQNNAAMGNAFADAFAKLKK